MTTQTEKARAFAALHDNNNPLLLHNIWDAGSAQAVAQAGAPAVATGSWSVAAAQGYPDGEHIPLERLQAVIERIAATVDLPLSVDIEGGYARDVSGLRRTIETVVGAGAVGINFEDRIVAGDGLYSIAEQAGRIEAIRKAADDAGVPLFINARTDLFLQSGGGAEHRALLPETLERARAYHDAGASGLFVPGLIDTALIGELCQASALSVNVMMMEGAPSLRQLADTGVARISYGPLPFVKAMGMLREFAADDLNRLR